MTLEAPGGAAPRRPTGEPVRIAVLGMPERAVHALQILVERQVPRLLELVPADAADVTLIDLDRYGSRELLEEHRRAFPHRIIVGTSLHDHPGDELDAVIGKPIRLDDLTATVLAAARRRRPPAAPTPADATQPSGRPPVEPPVVATPTARPPAVSPPTVSPPVAPPAVDRPAAHPPTRHSPPVGAPAFGHRGPDAPAITAPGRDLPPAVTPAVPATTTPAADDVTARPELVAWAPHRNAELSTRRAAAGINARAAGTYATDDDRVGYPPGDGSLLAVVRQALRTAQAKGRTTELRHSTGTIVVEQSGQLAATDIDAHRLRRLARQHGADARWTARTWRGPFPPPQASHLLTSEQLLWQLGAWTYGGELPPGTPVDLPVGLRRWPDLARHLPIPGAVRIAARWMDRPTSVEATVELLDIDPRHVHTFLAAAWAAGLVTFPVGATREGDGREATPGRDGTRRRLLGSILARLRER